MPAGPGIRPMVLLPNLPHRFYRGGPRLGPWREVVPVDEWRPEDWVASCVATHGADTQGLTRLPGGQLLRDAVRHAPRDWLGPEDCQRYGGLPALLVKLLDPGSRIPTHCHPDDEFAHVHLAAPCGKAEAWLVLHAEPGAEVHVGFRSAVSSTDLAGLVADGGRAVLKQLNSVPVAAGDTLFVPPGMPHSIPPGMLLLELQQPSDLSIMLEGPAVGDRPLGLDRDVAFGCVDRRAWSPQGLADLRAGSDPADLLAPGARRYFRLDRLAGGQTLEAGFSVLLVESGVGALVNAASGAAVVPLRAGAAVVVPHAAGSQLLEGTPSVLRCRPANPST